MPSSHPPHPETQSQRRYKYGGNVVLSCVIVILLAWALIYLVQSRAARIDTTLARSYSLKPQTSAVVANLNQKIRLVSLYPRAKDAEDSQDYYQPVADLLDEYARKSADITVDLIDPQTEPSKLDALIQQVTTQYGAELEPYKRFLDTIPAFTKDFKTFADTQAKLISALSIDGITDRELAQTILTAQATVTGLSQRLDDASENIASFLKGNLPNYRGAVDRVELELGILEQTLTRVTEDFRALPAATPAPIAAYAKESLSAYEDALKLVSTKLTEARALGNLKLDALRESIKRRTILVMGEKEMRVLGFADVWQAPEDLRAFVMSSGSPDSPRLKFAGEQQISTALVAVTQKQKPLAIFIRPGGVPLTQSLFRPAQFSVIARRLREANFQVAEKDLSGQFAMQAQMQGFPVVEASEDQLRDRSAVWIVVALTQAVGPQGPSPLGGKLAEHLTEGGSALILTEPDRDDLAPALQPWGVSARTDALIVKQPPPPPANAAAVESGDMIEQAERQPYIFLTTRFGDHPIARPINGLQALLLALSPVQYTAGPNRLASPLLPITREIRTWGETSIEPVFNNATPVFDPALDIPNTPESPLYAGVAVEKPSEVPATQPTSPARPQRLVVLGSATSFSNGILNIPDPELMKRGIPVSRFPANPELLVNSVYWLAGMDTMLAISPAAMEVARIGDIPPRQLAFIHWGVLIIGLPALVLIAGVGMYFHRRE